MTGIGAGMSGSDFSISLIVVPECTLRFGTPLYSSTTADSSRYHLPSSIFGALDFAQTTNRIPPDSSAMMPLWAIAGDAGVERETTFPSRVTQSPGCAAATGFCSVGPPAPPVLPPNPVAGAILNSFASSFDTLRSASAGWTPNSSMSRRSLPSTFWRSISFPVLENLREILSVASE